MFPLSYYDDYRLGEEFSTEGRTLVDADVAAYAGLSGDYDEKYLNMEKHGVPGKGRPVPPILLLGISHGLLTRTPLWDGPGGVAFIGIENLEFLAPVHVGDTVHGEVRVKDMRVSKSKPDRGIIQFEYSLVNQRGETVQRCVKKSMKHLRQPEGGK